MEQSVVWFPSRESGSLIDFGIGTRGLAPDEGILTRPGHKRRITALRRYLARAGVDCWVKHDPSALGISVPKAARDKHLGFEHVFKRYGAELYACARVPKEPSQARIVVQAFVDLYAFERGWQVMKAYEAEYGCLPRQAPRRHLRGPVAIRRSPALACASICRSAGAARNGQDSHGGRDPPAILRRPWFHGAVSSSSDVRRLCCPGYPPMPRTVRCTLMCAQGGSSKLFVQQERRHFFWSSTRSTGPI